MFSFRTTPLESQSDKSLLTGSVACFVSDSAFNPKTGHYSFEVFRSRGNLRKLSFATTCGGQDSRLSFSQEELEMVNAVVVDIQDLGCRHAALTRDVMRLLTYCARLETPPAVYIVDHPNPAGSAVESGMPAFGAGEWIPKAALRHGLTLGELCQLYADELGAKFPLHIISATLADTSALIPPASDAPTPLTPYMYSGHSLWTLTSLNPGLGTSRPYELVGAPWIRHDCLSAPPCPEEAVMRHCTFVPSYGLYKGEICNGYQIMVLDKVHYHSFLHFLSLAGYFASRYSQFEVQGELHTLISDPVVSEYLRGGIDMDIVCEAVKDGEQKWIRKARRYLLYDRSPLRMK